MNKFLYIILIVLYTLIIKPCLCQVVMEWQVHYIGPGIGDFMLSMCIDSYGNVYVTGSSNNTINSSDYATVMYSTSGVQQWSARYGGLPNFPATAFSVAADRFGNAYVTGYAPLVGGNGLFKYTTIKYNQSGVQCWVKIYYGSVYSAGNIPYSITTDYDANVYVTGGSLFDTTGYDYATIKYDSSGTEQWVARYRNPGQDWAKKVIVDNSGNVYVTGYVWGDTTYNDIATVKYNSSGVQQWAARYNGPGNFGDSATALEVDNFGNVYVTGRSWGGAGSGYDYVTIKYNQSGRQQWAARYNRIGNSIDVAHSLAVDDSANVYVTGETYYSGGSNYATIKYSPSGVQQWAALYNYQDGDHGYSIAVDNKGGVYVTGESWGGLLGTRYDFATIKYSTSGVQQWVIRTSGPLDEVPVQIAVDTSGNVYVAGNDGRYLTIKYNQLTRITPVSNEMPGEYRLYQNYPNPFNSNTKITFAIPQAGQVEIKVYDVLGRETKVVLNEFRLAGTYFVEFDASQLASGLYFYTLKCGTFTDTKKMLLLK